VLIAAVELERAAADSGAAVHPPGTPPQVASRQLPVASRELLGSFRYTKCAIACGGGTMTRRWLCWKADVTVSVIACI
jgi:hypothetical protein